MTESSYEEPLYQDAYLRIESNVNSPQEHLLYVNQLHGQEIADIPRGLLREFSRTPRGELEEKIRVFNPTILTLINQTGVTIDGLHVAICQAQLEENERLEVP